MIHRLALVSVCLLCFAGGSRDFVDESSHKLENNSWTAITGAPLSMGGWQYVDTGGTTAMTIISIGDASSANNVNMFTVEACQACTGTPQRCSTDGQPSTHTDDITLNTWQHAFGRFKSSTSRIVSLEDVQGPENTVDKTPTGVDALCVGCEERSPDQWFMDGRISMVAIWNDGWDTSKERDWITELHAGMWPSWVDTDSLQGFWPVFGVDSPELDLSGGGKNLTVTGATEDDLGPPVIFPIGGQ